MTHPCRANGCQIEVNDETLCCRNHWLHLSKPMQHAVYLSWKRLRVMENRADTDRALPPEQARDIRLGHLEAVADAIEALALLEGVSEVNPYRTQAKAIRKAMALATVDE